MADRTPDTPLTWTISDRADPRAVAIADRHYNRQKVGTPQFVPPGRCRVLLADKALWVTSWPFAEYTKHDWGGAWINSLFRNESAERSSELITQAVAITRAFWEPPPLGIVTFVNPQCVKPTYRRGQAIYGYCYLKAGWRHVGYTKENELWAWQQLPEEMPAPAYELLHPLLVSC